MCHHRAAESAHAFSQFVGTPGEIATPERHTGNRARRFRYNHPVIGHIHHTPDLRTKHECIANTRLKDEFLIQLAELGLAIAQIGAKGACIRNGATVSQGEHPRTGKRRQLIVDAVPIQSRAQLPVSLTGVAPGKHFQRGLEGTCAEIRIRIGATDQRKKIVHLPRLDRNHRHNLLRQHIQRVAGRARRFYFAA
ncbi:MAG: hypothetical protein BWY63_00643 [Chloroflexi bacterium ADurb.Bin360]|nr:MAG: hypothetical protein BWY63_00643 [Chloroflexi bacterium ADurb.Bin360]